MHKILLMGGLLSFYSLVLADVFVWILADYFFEGVLFCIVFGKGGVSYCSGRTLGGVAQRSNSRGQRRLFVKQVGKKFKFRELSRGLYTDDGNSREGVLGQVHSEFALRWWTGVALKGVVGEPGFLIFNKPTLTYSRGVDIIA